jgi:hypothetical protein
LVLKRYEVVVGRFVEQRRGVLEEGYDVAGSESAPVDVEGEDAEADVAALVVDWFKSLRWHRGHRKC